MDLSEKARIFRDACRDVIAYCNNEYAKAYAKAGLRIQDNAEEMRVQALYIRSNLSHWRGAASKSTKVVLEMLSGKDFWAE